MTFPNIPADTAEAAAAILAGDNPSRAATYSAQMKLEEVLDAIHQAHKESANCDVCGHFHPMTEHPANAHSAETTPEPAEATREQWRTTPEGARTNMRHDHAMCDPDRNCGPDAGASYAAIPKLERESGGNRAMSALCTGDQDCRSAGHVEGCFSTNPDFAVPIAARRSGKTTTARLMATAHIPPYWASHDEKMAQLRLKMAADLVAANPDQWTEKDGVFRRYVWTQGEANKLREDLRMTPAEALQPAIDTINGIRESLPFHPGGSMWSENQEREGLQRLAADIDPPQWRQDGDKVTAPGATFPGYTLGNLGAPHTVVDGACIPNCTGSDRDPNESRYPGDGGPRSGHFPRTDEDRPGPEAPTDEEACCPRIAPEDKLRIIADVVDAQQPLGTELASFKRRLSLILDMQ